MIEDVDVGGEGVEGERPGKQKEVQPPSSEGPRNQTLESRRRVRSSAVSFSELTLAPIGLPISLLPTKFSPPAPFLPTLNPTCCPNHFHPSSTTLLQPPATRAWETVHPPSTAGGLRSVRCRQRCRNAEDWVVWT
ncbi:hypothetical protein BDY24DRAFT_231410 [Mrakia frigida]|uniref:uncharacterized protein n=1 Tax=Mrakia frigida TaxID=29902 RepID=UPI003FCC06E3